LRNELDELIDDERSASATFKGIAPNFVHSIDGNHVRAVVLSTDADILHTHDDIGTHPEDFFSVNQVIRTTFVQLHTEYNWLDSLSKYSKVHVGKFHGGYDVQDALKATYLFS
jgi:DNA-directed RNA polymerase